MSESNTRFPQYGLRVAVVGLPGKWSTEQVADAFARRTGFRMVVDLSRLSVDLEQRRARYDGVNLRELDALVVKKLDAEYSPSMLERLEILRFIEEMGVRVFPPARALCRLVDRLACTVALRGAGIPMPPTVITEDIEYAVDAAERFGGAVLKPLYSTKGRGMQLLECGERDAMREAVRSFQAAGNRMLYVQKRLNLPDRDLGVVFVGGKYLTCYARVRGEGAWNTTTHQGGVYAPHVPSDTVVEIARRAQALFDLAFTVVDVVELPEGPKVFEVSAFGGFRGVHEATGIDAAERYADHVLETVRHAR